jgi:hypothetical protein
MVDHPAAPAYHESVTSSTVQPSKMLGPKILGLGAYLAPDP